MKIARTLAFLALLVSAPMAAFDRAVAQSTPPSAEALAVARELVAIVSKETIRPMTTQMMAQIWPGIERKLRAKQPNITAEQVADLRGECDRIFFDYMTSLMDDAPALYARHFSAAELREVLAFQRSPVGQKSLREMPQLMGELFQIIMPKLQQAQGQLIDAFAKVARQKGFNI